MSNLPIWERVLRIAVAAAAVAASVHFLDGLARWLAVSSAAGFGVTGLIGFCPACAMVGRRLQRR